MSSARGWIDPSEFKETNAIIKSVCFLAMSPLIVTLVRHVGGQKVEIGTLMAAGMYVLGTVLGMVGGFAGGYLGRTIQNFTGPIAVHERTAMDIFLRKVRMKIGPSLIGCIGGALFGSGGLLWLFI